MLGDLVLVAGLWGTFEACDCTLREVSDAACIGRPWKRRYEGMITVFDPELIYCKRARVEVLEAPNYWKIWGVFGELFYLNGGQPFPLFYFISELLGVYAFPVRLSTPTRNLRVLYFTLYNGTQS